MIVVSKAQAQAALLKEVSSIKSGTAEVPLLIFYSVVVVVVVIVSLLLLFLMLVFDVFVICIGINAAVGSGGADSTTAKV